MALNLPGTNPITQNSSNSDPTAEDLSDTEPTAQVLSDMNPSDLHTEEDPPVPVTNTEITRSQPSSKLTMDMIQTFMIISMENQNVMTEN